jgi:hypothetical protein
MSLRMFSGSQTRDADRLASQGVQVVLEMEIHAQSIIASDFLVVVTARFRTLYVFLLMGVGRRRIVHCNVTAHPTAARTLQQLREAIPSDHSYRFLIRDRDSIFSGEVDRQLKAFEPAAVILPLQGHDRHSLAQDCKVATRAVLGGLHHEYRWEGIAA